MAKLTLSFRDKKLRIFPLTCGEAVIGRDPDCEIHIDSLAVQPRHAVIAADGEHYRIQALEGEEQLFVNNQQVDERLLADGDHIRIGKHILTFSEEPGDNLLELPRFKPQPATGWLQIMSGSHLGRTIRLDRSMLRLGKSGQQSAMISRRSDGYYLSHLEGDEPPQVNQQPIGERSRRLADGDQIRIGRLELHFFLDQGESRGAPAPVPKEERHERRFSRIPFDGEARLSQDGKNWRSRLIDLSLKGALIERPADWEGNGGEYLLRIELGDDRQIEMQVELSHQEEGRIGLRCKDIDLDSITELRRLVELNLADPALLERELARLG
ncbi:FHA domain-containing protein [Thiohalobacter sp. IOR34]|uniref:FHA domain-containing protein n=1 Tax=Thiohalobacter sp. IOR34 TaxID=3057176 RepID=UPI0025AFAD6D|nr:FHA domain-containing protein [Thiohalobacter sp. IOR34]WJW74784.1 FHA domain-containing protein [Thiohalobacter sp. IOR34]